MNIEQVVINAMKRERGRHRMIETNYRTDCSCGVNLSAPSVWMERELFDAHVESAALNVVRTERERVPCPECADEPGGADPDCVRCEGDGSVPGKLLVVGLIGEQAGWSDGFLLSHYVRPGYDKPVWIEREAP